jgi:hypothetical protein
MLKNGCHPRSENDDSFFGIELGYEFS